MTDVLSWVKGIFVISILTDIAIHLVPSKKYEKYVRYICGIGLLAVCMNPLAVLLNIVAGSQNSISIERVYKSLVNEQEMKSLQNELKYNDYSDSSQITDALKEKVKEDTSSKINDAGYNAVKVIIQIQDNSQQVDYGKVSSISAVITKKNKSAADDPIDLKKKLSEYYEIGEEDITIKLR